MRNDKGVMEPLCPAHAADLAAEPSRLWCPDCLALRERARAAADPNWARRCEHCDAVLPPGHVPVYCSTACAEADA